MLPSYLKELFTSQQYDENNFFLIAGPCVVESEELLMEVSAKVSSICNRLAIPYVFKASYRKANRTSANSFTGIGDEQALQLLKKVNEKFSLPVTSDVHAHDETGMAAAYIDILQIPAFLCRQTDLLIAAAETGKIVNVKKGQFVSGPSMKFAVEKIKKAGNEKIILTERGNSFRIPGFSGGLSKHSLDAAAQRSCCNGLHPQSSKAQSNKRYNRWRSSTHRHHCKGSYRCWCRRPFYRDASKTFCCKKRWRKHAAT